MHRIVWLDLNSSFSHTSLALPLLYLASEKSVSCEWHVIRGVISDNPFSLASRIVELNPDIVASSLYLFNRAEVMAVLARIKVLLPETITIVGGPECLGDNRDLLAGTEIDAAFRGEGENGFPEWLQCVEQKDRWGTVQGLCFLDTDGVYIDGGIGRPVENLDTSPCPATSRFFLTDRPFVQIETSRGCPYRCTFCTSGAAETPLRAAPISAIREQLREVRQRGVQDIRILDRTFNKPSSRCVELLGLFRQEFSDMRFHLEILPEMLTPDVRNALSEALPGQLHIEAGIQTFSPDARRAVKRHGSSEEAAEGIRFLMSCTAFDTHVDLLAGLPHQSLDDIFADVRTLIGLGPAEIQLEILKMLPGTEIREHADSYGIRYAPFSPYEVLATNTMSTRDLVTVLGLSRMLDRFYNTPHIQGAFRAAAQQSEYFLEDALTTLRKQGLLNEPVSMKRRMQAFYDLIPPTLTEARDLLELEWVLAGLSPSHALAPTSPWKHPLPDDVTSIEPFSADNEQRRNQKVWHMQSSVHEYWIVYGSGSPRNGPAYVCKRPPETTAF